MDSAVVLLALACAVLAVTCAILSGVVPFLYWRCLHCEARLAALEALVNKNVCVQLSTVLTSLAATDTKLDTLDEAVAGILEVAVGPRYPNNGAARTTAN